MMKYNLTLLLNLTLPALLFSCSSAPTPNDEIVYFTNIDDAHLFVERAIAAAVVPPGEALMEFYRSLRTSGKDVEAGLLESELGAFKKGSRGMSLDAIVKGMSNDELVNFLKKESGRYAWFGSSQKITSAIKTAEAERAKLGNTESDSNVNSTSKAKQTPEHDEIVKAIQHATNAFGKTPVQFQLEKEIATRATEIYKETGELTMTEKSCEGLSEKALQNELTFKIKAREVSRKVTREYPKDLAKRAERFKEVESCVYVNEMGELGIPADERPDEAINLINRCNLNSRKLIPFIEEFKRSGVPAQCG